jgi:hypothetical protein
MCIGDGASLGECGATLRYGPFTGRKKLVGILVGVRLVGYRLVNCGMYSASAFAHPPRAHVRNARDVVASPSQLASGTATSFAITRSSGDGELFHPLAIL